MLDYSRLLAVGRGCAEGKVWMQVKATPASTSEQSRELLGWGMGVPNAAQVSAVEFILSSLCSS